MIYLLVCPASGINPAGRCNNSLMYLNDINMISICQVISNWVDAKGMYSRVCTDFLRESFMKSVAPYGLPQRRAKEVRHPAQTSPEKAS